MGSKVLYKRLLYALSTRSTVFIVSLFSNRLSTCILMQSAKIIIYCIITAKLRNKFGDLVVICWLLAVGSKEKPHINLIMHGFSILQIALKVKATFYIILLEWELHCTSDKENSCKGNNSVKLWKHCQYKCVCKYIVSLANCCNTICTNLSLT